MEQLIHSASTPLLILSALIVVSIVSWNSYQVLRHGHLPQKGLHRKAEPENLGARIAQESVENQAETG